MNIAKLYAHALYELAKDASTSEQKKYGENLISLLKKKGHYRLLPQIESEYQTVLAQQETEQESVLQVVAEGDVVVAKQELLKENIQLDRATVVVDDTLIGGYVYSDSNIVRDASYKRALISLYQKLVT